MKIAAVSERKAISPIIATVLIIAATLIAFAAIGGYTFGIFGGATSTANVQIVSLAMKAADFLSTGTTTTFTTGAVTGDYITLTNTGTASATVTGVTVVWAGASNAFTQGAGSFVVGASGTTGANGATTSVLFPTTSKLATSAVSGQSFSVSVTLSNGAILTYQSTWL